MKSRGSFLARLFVALFGLMMAVCQGPQGPAGPEGREGPQGEQGPPGAPGVSIVWKGELGTAPSAPEPYWAYFDTTSGNAYIYTGEKWELLSHSGAAGAPGVKGADGVGGGVSVSVAWQGTQSSAPADPQTNWAYYNTTDKKSYIYDGTAWQVLAADGADGAKGDPGPQGPANGPKGDKGDDGKSAYLVIFNSNGGSPALDAVGVTSGNQVALPADGSFEKSGYIVAGWYTDKNCTDPYTFSSPVTGNLTLYALWERSGTELVDSRDGKTYRTVDIEGVVWMAENLNYAAAGSKCYGEGGQVWDSDISNYKTLSSAEIQANCATYGRLYDWATAMNGAASSNSIPSGVQGVCPAGSHLPSDAEWTALTDYVGDPAGTKLKATTGWNSYEGVPAGTDNVEFSALPGGNGNSAGNFYSAGYNGYWWSSTENGA